MKIPWHDSRDRIPARIQVESLPVQAIRSEMPRPETLAHHRHRRQVVALIFFRTESAALDRRYVQCGKVVDGNHFSLDPFRLISAIQREGGVPKSGYGFE